ncbi:MAG TPA: dTMP kinase [Spirochaetota bacterium]|nr:dTMP kinase [Spirochaetota bacterium]HPC39864.1 dTMP kinase [Spirochaetota bacterium]HPL17794.1 dTMP kinase [Spirochaetota bacterium]HQF08960.1 dTMP kinase [Spirochaetota bacterium]HQH98768.1 dTMP kinase [Spirochaetota bacterium]
MKRPLFVVFEGIDGSGKSTQCDLLFGHAVSLGLPAVKLAEPTDGRWGRKIRAMLREKEMAPAEEQMRLFLLDRQEDAEKNIIPALRENRIIIMDRYYFSNAAYQGAAGMAPEQIIAENRKMNFPEPDRVYFVDLPPDRAMERVTVRSGGEQEVFEKESLLQKVRENFLSIADGRFLVLDGTGSIDEIFEVIRNDFNDLVTRVTA